MEGQEGISSIKVSGKSLEKELMVTWYDMLLLQTIIVGGVEVEGLLCC